MIATNEAEALKQCNTMLLGVQKSRSISMENLGDQAETVGAQLMPWLFGPKNILAPLTRFLLGCKHISPMEYVNFMTIAVRLEPSIAICSLALGQLPLPTPEEMDDIWKVLGGWTS